jgi:HD-like signal output (HDOD) protein
MASDEYFRFVKSLAMDLNSNDLKLTSFPDVVMRIRSALNDPDTTSEKLAEILSVDAVLASRMLVLANSTFYSPAGIKIQSLAAAVGRIGFEKVRTSAISYAVEILHASKDLVALKDELRQSWSAGLRLAAMSEAIAHHCSELDCDSAFIAGLLHRIGVLYIYTKYDEYPTLLQDDDARRNLVNEWAAPIGESIVSNWGFSDEIKGTMNPNEDGSRTFCDDANLADVVIAAKTSLAGDGARVCEMIQGKRLGMLEEKMPEIMESYQSKLGTLAAAVR